MKTKRGRTALVCAAAVLLLALVAGLYLWQPPCLFREWFGVLCPGCGVTRMAEALLRLDFAGAFRCNPFMLCVLPLCGAYMLWEAVRFIRFRSPVYKMRFFVPAAVCVLLAALAFAVCRNISGFAVDACFCGVLQ